MSKLKRATITGIGGYVPEKILTNKDLEQIVDTTDDWITARTGIKERHILEEGQGTSFMGERAVQELLTKTNTAPEEVECLICATVTPDMVFPSTANVITDRLGMTNAFGFDIEAACSGFLYALSIATKYIESGFCQKVVVLGADKMSSIIDYTDRETCIIFGDGAAAAMVEATDNEEIGIQDILLKSDGSGRKHLYQKSGGSLSPPTIASVVNREHYVKQEGRAVFKTAVTKMAEISVEMMERNQLQSTDIRYLVPHQANKRIIYATAKKMGVSNESIMMNIQRYGNTTSATIPLCLWDYENELRKGDKLIMSAFGGGFTWGSTYLVWGYDTK